jgi:hypothetical protein
MKSQKFEYKIKGIEVLNSEINIPEKPLPGKVLFSFDVSLEQRFNMEQELIFVLCDITTFTSDNSDLKLGRIKSSCIFNVKDLKNYITDGNQVKLPEEFVNTINTISVSTTRGLMFSLFKGTFLHGAILPVIDPAQYKTKKVKKV